VCLCFDGRERDIEFPNRTSVEDEWVKMLTHDDKNERF
jgi:hypothetical protein